jgi:hypothetical protein
MPRGRPPKGAKLVEKLDGSEEAKRRLELVLQTIAGKRDVASVCEELGIKKTAFVKIRDKVLQSALQGIEPKPSGRPRKEPEKPDRVTELEKQVEHLKKELTYAHVREEILTTMPELYRPEAEKKRSKQQDPVKTKREKAKKKKAQQKKERRKARRKKF